MALLVCLDAYMGLSPYHISSMNRWRRSLLQLIDVHTIVVVRKSRRLLLFLLCQYGFSKTLNPKP